MRKKVLLCSHILFHLSFLLFLVYSAIDFKSSHSKLSFLLMAITIILHSIIKRKKGEVITTVLDTTKIALIIHSVFFALVVILYVQFQNNVSIFYLIIFGLHFLTFMYKDYRILRKNEIK